MKSTFLNSLLILLLKVSSLTGQNLLDKDFEKANKLYSDGFFQEAYVAFEKVAPGLLEDKRIDQWVLAIGRCAENQLYFKNETLKAHKLLNTLDENILISKDPRAQSRLYLYLGNYYDFISQPDSALYFLNLAENRSANLKESRIFKAEIAQSIGNVYRWSFYNFYQAEKYYRSATLLLENESEYRLSASLSYNLATVLRLKGDYEGGLEMAYKSLALYKKIPSNTERQVVNIYTTIANIYFETERHEKAIQILQPLIERVKKNKGSLSTELLVYQLNLVAFYIENRDFEESSYQLAEVAKIIQKNKLEGQPLADYYFQFGIVKMANKEWHLAEENFRKCEEIRLRLYGNKHPQIGRIWQERGEIFLIQNNHLKALEYIQKSISAYLVNFSYNNNLENPDTLTYSGKDLANAFLLKGDILLEIYTAHKQTRFLFQAFDTYQKAIEVIKLNRQNFEQEQSQLFAASYSKKIYEKALNCLYILQENSPKNKTNGLAFDIMGQSKATLLKEQINKSLLFKSMGVPDSILVIEADLKSDLFVLQNALSELEDQPIKEIEVREKILAKNASLEKLKKYLQTNYPFYSEVRFGKQNSTADDVKKKLSDRESSLVEYFWGENSLYALVLTEDLEKLYSFPQTEENLNHLKNLALKTRSFSTSLLDFQSFAGSSSFVYQKWWQPFDSLLTEKVIVIPDGPLSFLPFEVLLTKPVQIQLINYKSLPYLIHKTQITYHYSSDIKRVGRNDSRAILAMGYSAPGLSKEPGFDQLEGAYWEVEKISKLMDGEFLTGMVASKEYFKNNANRFGYLHLAIHGIGDTVSFYKSYLHFRGKSSDNNNLYINELFSLRLPGSQVMLSACETGVGESFSGEGVYSIGRAFLQAGASSVVHTLWKVPDQISLQIITDYYQLISDKTEAGTALRKSKLQFLKQSDEVNSHPSLWAAWSFIGEETEEPFSLLDYWPFYLGFSIIMAAILGIVLRKRL